MGNENLNVMNSKRRKKGLSNVSGDGESHRGKFFLLQKGSYAPNTMPEIGRMSKEAFPITW